jgi:hypothetical protein
VNPVSFVSRWTLRLLLLVVGLVFAASLALATVLLLGAWSVRAVWARLTGRTVNPFVMRVSPRSGFERIYPSQTARAPTVRRDNADVTDVQPKEPRG